MIDEMTGSSFSRGTDVLRRLRSGAEELFMRVAASGVVPARLFLRSVPDEKDLPARTGDLTLEIVSHCWKYQTLLAYQLGSLVKHPPSRLTVTMTVFYSPEDAGTCRLLETIGEVAVEGVTWNWVALEKERLFRRAIGRNMAARASSADWIWFTDCDVLFHEGALDSLAECLQGRRDRLVFPRVEWVTPLLDKGDPMFNVSTRDQPVLEVDTSRFRPRPLDVAKGPMQITHGDVSRAVGYCEQLSVYQRPANHWRKAWEDRAYRWLLRTEGTPLEVSSVYRIRHASKGRYTDGTVGSRIRGGIRLLESTVKERLRDWRQK